MPFSSNKFGFGTDKNNPLVVSPYTQKLDFGIAPIPPSSNLIITEDGDFMITEDGSFIETE